VFYWICANLLVVIHLAFVCFVVAGGLLVWKWRWILFLHIPAAAWGALIEYQGWVCPLTPMEQRLRQAGGQEGYSGGFIEHYLLPMLYPSQLSREVQVSLGTAVLVINIAVYGLLMARLVRGRKRAA
jgi:hypothetical protein